MPCSAPPIRAIAFDLDGTLVDSPTDIAAAANAARAELDLAPLADSRVRSFIGDGSAMLMARTAGRPGPRWMIPRCKIAARAHFSSITPAWWPSTPAPIPARWKA